MPTEGTVFATLKYRVEVGLFGTRKYYNSAGQLHCADWLAVEHCNGAGFWLQDGKRPACVRAVWFKAGN